MFIILILKKKFNFYFKNFNIFIKEVFIRWFCSTNHKDIGFFYSIFGIILTFFINLKFFIFYLFLFFIFLDFYSVYFFYKFFQFFKFKSNKFLIGFFFFNPLVYVTKSNILCELNWNLFFPNILLGSVSIYDSIFFFYHFYTPYKAIQMAYTFNTSIGSGSLNNGYFYIGAGVSLGMLANKVLTPTLFEKISFLPSVILNRIFELNTPRTFYLNFLSELHSAGSNNCFFLKDNLFKAILSIRSNPNQLASLQDSSDYVYHNFSGYMYQNIHWISFEYFNIFHKTSNVQQFAHIPNSQFGYYHIIIDKYRTVAHDPFFSPNIVTDDKVSGHSFLYHREYTYTYKKFQTPQSEMDECSNIFYKSYKYTHEMVSLYINHFTLVEHLVIIGSVTLVSIGLYKLIKNYFYLSSNSDSKKSDSSNESDDLED